MEPQTCKQTRAKKKTSETPRQAHAPLAWYNIFCARKTAHGRRLVRTTRTWNRGRALMAQWGRCAIPVVSARQRGDMRPLVTLQTLSMQRAGTAGGFGEHGTTPATGFECRGRPLIERRVLQVTLAAALAQEHALYEQLFWPACGPARRRGGEGGSQSWLSLHMCSWQMFSTWRGQATAPFSPVAAWTTPCACGMLPQVGRRSWWHMWISEKAVPWTAHHRRTPCSHLVESRCAWCLDTPALHTLLAFERVGASIRVALSYPSGAGACSARAYPPALVHSGGQTAVLKHNNMVKGVVWDPVGTYLASQARPSPRGPTFAKRVVRACTPRAAARRACPVAWSYLAGQLQCALTPARYVCA